MGGAKKRETTPHNNPEVVKCVLAEVHIKSDWITRNRPIVQSDLLSLHCTSRLCRLQLDWTSWADAHKINLPWDCEGYDRLEYTDEKLSTRRIHWCKIKFYIFFFEELFLKIDGKCPNFLTTHSLMRLFESSNTEVWGGSEVPQSRGKLFFRKSSCCVFARKSISLVKIRVDRDRSKY